MFVKTILKHLQAGRQVTYTVRRLRGYLHGEATLVFLPKDAEIGANNLQMILDNFRHDEAPYDKPQWVVEDSAYEVAVQKLEAEGLTRSDAQAVVDAQLMSAKVVP